MLHIPYRNLLDFEIADEPSKEIYFLFGVRKSGSSVLNNIVRAIATMNDMHYIDVAGSFFQKGVRVAEWQFDPELGTLLRPGNLYAGFRNFPVGLAQDARLLKGRKVLMVRDPRDALVSEYFSNAFSHSIPQSGQTRKDMLSERAQALNSEIDAFVLKKAPSMKTTLREYSALQGGPALKLFRYEDVITEKRALIAQLCEFYSWAVSELQVDQILGWADVMPSVERPTEFVRKVIPGDHREKLRTGTIDRLNEIFADEMAQYGYR